MARYLTEIPAPPGLMFVVPVLGLFAATARSSGKLGQAVSVATRSVVVGAGDFVRAWINSVTGIVRLKPWAAEEAV